MKHTTTTLTPSQPKLMSYSEIHINQLPYGVAVCVMVVGAVSMQFGVACVEHVMLSFVCYFYHRKRWCKEKIANNQEEEIVWEKQKL